MTQRKWIERLQQATLGDYLRGRASRRCAGTRLRLLVTGFVVSAASNKYRMPCANSSTDRKSTRLNSSHTVSSYAVFCVKKQLRTDRNHCAGVIRQQAALGD